MRGLSNLPPGVTDRMIDEAAGAFDCCEVCKLPVDDCIWPECPNCNDVGNPGCYGIGIRSGDFLAYHTAPLRLNKAQLLSRSKAKIAELLERAHDEEQYQI